MSILRLNFRWRGTTIANNPILIADSGVKRDTSNVVFFLNSERRIEAIFCRFLTIFVSFTYITVCIGSSFFVQFLCFKIELDTGHRVIDTHPNAYPRNP